MLRCVKHCRWLADAALAQPAQAQLNPSRQITIVVPIGAGGGVDATGRLFAEKLQERLKQPVVVENRPAAGGMVGTDSVAKAAPDGHTLLLMETSSVLHKWLHKNVPFDVVADFTPIARVAISPLILFASPSFAPNNARELIALAKARARQAVGRHARRRHAASSGLMMLNALAKIDIVNVPYRGAALVAERRARGPDPDGLGGADRGDAACRHRQGEDAGRRVGAARAVAAGRADHRRERRAGLRSRHLVRRLGAGQDAARCGRASVQGDRRDRRAARRQGAHREDRPERRPIRRRDSSAQQVRDDHERFGKIIRDAGIKPN